MEAGPSLVLGDAELSARTKRHQLQCGDKRLRKVPEVGGGPELVARDAAFNAAVRRDQLKRGGERLREGPQVGAGLELVGRDAVFYEVGLDRLQHDH